MKPAIFLRIVSVLMLIQAVLHTIGGVFGTPPPGAGAAAAAAMKANQFLLEGHTRSYWDFFLGFGLAITISITMEAIVIWQLASLAKENAAKARPMVITFTLGYLLLGINAWRFFFSGPVICEAIIVTLLILAIATTKKRSAAAEPLALSRAS